VSFDVSADAYDRFMGRYSTLLAPVFCDFAGVARGMRVLDVGAGSGALTVELAARVGVDAVVALEPSAQFVESLPERLPGVSVVHAAAEEIPLAGGELDAALAQLVVHFMSDPPAGIAEMARVTRPGGIVAACVWDHGTGRGPLSPFWAAARTLDLATGGESKMVGASPGQLADLLNGAGLRDVEETAIAVSVEHPSFEEWWEPFELGVGPAGVYVSKLEPDRRAALRERCRELLPPAPFTVDAHAWTARGTV
jgi:SAM-dependent methyltransferase